MPIQQMLLGSGAGAKKTYLDDIFSTFLYTGNETARTINNGVDTTEGAMVWVKNRDNSSFPPYLYDTKRGTNKQLRSSSSAAETSGSNTLTAFNNNGISLGTDTMINRNNDSHVAWTFRKSPMFTIAQWTGNGVAGRQIPHDLGSRPGMVAIKCTSDNHNWSVWHRGLSSNAKTLTLNDNAAEFTNDAFNGAAPSSTVIHVSSTNASNANTKTYVAYLWAGGESNASEARSVDFDGSNDYLSIPDSSDFTIGTNYTAECWFYTDAITGAGWDGIFGQWSGNNNASTNSWVLESVGNSFVPRFYYINSGGTLAFKSLVDEANGEVLALKQWYHFAFVKSGSTTKLYLNGILKQSFDTTYQDGSGSFNIGGNVASGGWFNGKVSNVRIVNGTAVYTSSFRPPTAPLTNITNTKLLCCNDSSQTGSTVTPGTITNNGSTASSDSPFDDPAGFVFGDAEDQNVIKTGSYVGTGSANVEVNVGFEPSWIMVKNITAGGLWLMADNMRGVVNGGDDPYLQANDTNAEYTTYNWIEFTSTGFKLTNTGVSLNANGNKYVYICIRRSDGYVGKPPSLGNQVFTPVFGSANAPMFKSNNHIVDFSLQKNSNFATQDVDWNATARSISGKKLATNTIAEETTNQYQVFDYQSGQSSYASGSGIRFAWLWKRHAGMDVVAYTGNGVAGRQVPHGLNAVPEMMWVKRRTNGSGGTNWLVYHKGLNGGSSPENYYLLLNGTSAETATTAIWNDTAPTSTNFTVGNNSNVNSTDKETIAILFASVAGISKLGSYTGNATDSDPTSGTNTITFGFQPRMVIIKSYDASNTSWHILDTLRGWTTGDSTKRLRLNLTNAQSTEPYGYPTSTGMVLTGNGDGHLNNSGDNYIYYAHA